MSKLLYLYTSINTLQPQRCFYFCPFSSLSLSYSYICICCNIWVPLRWWGPSYGNRFLRRREESTHKNDSVLWYSGFAKQKWSDGAVTCTLTCLKSAQRLAVFDACSCSDLFSLLFYHFWNETVDECNGVSVCWVSPLSCRVSCSYLHEHHRGLWKHPPFDFHATADSIYGH